MGGHAWVTLATNDSYSLGALVLAHSLKQVGTQQQLAVLITPGVTGSMRAKLSEVFNVVMEVNLLDSKDETNLRLLKRPELGVTFTKLHCWRLTQFDKCVFLDADTLVLENCDELFDREELSAAPDIGWPDCFNSGVFVFRPSMETHEKIIQFAIEKGSFDGGDQGLLNLYFSDWAHKDISKHLPFIYNMASTACYSYLPAFKQFGRSAKIIHFIGASKPWLQYFDTESRQVHPSEGVKHLQEILQLWWNIFCNLIHPSLSPEMTSRSDTVHGSQSSTYQSPTQSCPTPDASNPAEDYQKVWDPWEEYDYGQQGSQSGSQILHETSNLNEYRIPETPSQLSDNQSIKIEKPQSHHPSEHHHFESHSSERHDIDISPVSQHDNQSSPIEYHNIQHQIRPVEHHNIQSHHVEYHHYQRHDNHSHRIQHNSGRTEHIKPHNTNACIEADNHNHDHPTHVYSQPHTPSTLPAEEHQFSTKQPPPDHPPIPKLPAECMATTTVSNEMTLQTDSEEDSTDKNAGLAGAFAKLTLGSPRTAEQRALDDHLRRQGWEVGHIDYLGKDSFDNIWNKICLTLSSAPEQTTTKKEPSPTAESKPVEDMPVEVKCDEQQQSMEVASSGDQPIQQVREAKPVETLTTNVTQEPVAQPIGTPEAETAKPLACDQITVTAKIEQVDAKKIGELKTDATATEITPTTVSEPTGVPEQMPKEAPVQQVEVPTPVVETSVTNEPATQPIETQVAEKLACDQIAVTKRIELVEAEKIANTVELKTDAKTTESSPTPIDVPKPLLEQVELPTPVTETPVPKEPVPTPTLETKKEPGVTPVQIQQVQTVAPVAETLVPTPPLESQPAVETSSPVTPSSPVPETAQLTPLITPKLDPTSTTKLPTQPTAEEPHKPTSKVEKVSRESPTPVTVKSQPEQPAPRQPVESPKPLSEPHTPSGEHPKQSAEQTEKASETVCPKKSAEEVEKLVEPVVTETGKKPATPEMPIAPAKKLETQVTAPTPPIVPESKQPELKVATEALKVETSTPATPPPDAQQTSSGPTPPPRKSSGGTKKTTKPKK